MCYTGGPRCSSHVGDQLTAAQGSFYANMDDDEVAMKFHEQVEDLEREYNSTPGGQKMLAAEISALRNEGKQEEANRLESQLEAAKSLREHDMEQRKIRLAGGDKATRSCELPAESSAETKRINQQDRDLGRAPEKAEPVASKKLNPVQVSNESFSSYEDSLVPQADNVDKISSLVESVNSGATTSSSIAETLNMADRGGNYYANAAEYIGLVHKNESTYEGGSHDYSLTENGEAILNSGPEERATHMRRMINATPYMKVYHENNRDKQAVVNSMMEYGLDEKTAERRASSVVTWDATVNSESFSNDLDASHKVASERSLVAAENLQKKRKLLKQKSNEQDDSTRKTCMTCFRLKPLSGVCDECD